MARTVNEDEHRAKRDAILDAGQRLVETEGYEKMAIQDVIDELGISKGAFYHYFDSKPALLLALVERRGDELERLVLPIVEDQRLSALDKLRLYFATHDRFKRERQDFVLEFTRVWYADENAVFRLKLAAEGRERIAPWLSQIIREGVEEGVFATPYPDQAARMIVALLEELGERIAELLMRPEARDLSGIPEMTEMTEMTEATADALERLLGAEPGCIRDAWREAISQW